MAGEVLAVSPTLVDGTVSTGGDITVGGVVLEVSPVLVAGSVSVPGQEVEDDGSNTWAYAKEQRRKRAAAKALRTPKVIEARHQLAGLRSVADVAVLPVVGTVLPVEEITAPETDPEPVVEAVVISAHAQLPMSRITAELRIVNILDEYAQMEEQVRDLQDMVDLYELLMAA